ncbi:MAG: phosphatidylglycerophosphatase A, partial [Zetaproteobacteria bacterium]
MRISARGWDAWLCAGLGSGWLPTMPGTWGSLAALGPAAVMVSAWGAMALLGAALLLLALGCWLCARLLPRLDESDPGWIVIDEWVGVW